jgi:hypothetical protein
MRKSTILGPKGQVLNPDPPAGFYMVGVCPTCANPVYFHGGGRGHKQATEAELATIFPIEPKVYKLCLCPDDTDFEIQVPKAYDLAQERDDIDTLFAAILSMVGNFGQMQRFAMGMQEQLQEFADERSRYLPEEATTGDSGEDNPREPIPITRASQPQL